MILKWSRTFCIDEIGRLEESRAPGGILRTALALAKLLEAQNGEEINGLARR
jgi:hypothetical protein